MTFAWSQWISTVSSRSKKLGLEPSLRSPMQSKTSTIINALLKAIRDGRIEVLQE